MKNDNIEDIYSELKTFSKEPPKELWDNIEARLHPKKKRRGMLWFWGSAAAILVLLLGYMFTNSVMDDQQPVEKVSDVEHIEEDANDGLDEQTTKVNEKIVTKDSNKDSLKNNQSLKNEHSRNVGQGQLSDRSNAISQKEQMKSIMDNAPKKRINRKQEQPDSKLNEGYAQTEKNDIQNDVNNNEAIKDGIIGNTDSAKDVAITPVDSISKVKENPLPNSLKTLMAKNKSKEDSINIGVAETSKWSFEVLGGLSNTMSESTVQNTKVNTTPQNDFVYTFKVAYAISDRLVVKSGIGNNVLGQEINNIGYASSSDEFSSENSQSIVNNESISFFASPELASDGALSNDNFSEGNLQQQFSYVQVPLEVSYKILAKTKYDVSLGLGGNINFITANRAFLDDEEIGENIGANNTVFGASLNTSISYELANKWILFLEPSYNYFQKPIDNNNQSFSNSQLRFLFGLRFKL